MACGNCPSIRLLPSFWEIDLRCHGQQELRGFASRAFEGLTKSSCIRWSPLPFFGKGGGRAVYLYGVGVNTPSLAA